MTGIASVDPVVGDIVDLTSIASVDLVVSDTVDLTTLGFAGISTPTIVCIGPETCFAGCELGASISSNQS